RTTTALVTTGAIRRFGADGPEARMSARARSSCGSRSVIAILSGRGGSTEASLRRYGARLRFPRFPLSLIAYALPILKGSPVPTGKVKWYDTDKGFGFVSRDDGGDVFVHSSALPAGVEALKPGSRVEFGVAEGKRGEQALSVRVLEAPPSLVQSQRKKPDEMVVIVEDVIKL